MIVGFHFFTEGTDKLHNGFDARYFLSDAKGPLAPSFRSLVRDVDGRERLCVLEKKLDSGEVRLELNPEMTFAQWNDFLDQVFEVYDFGSEKKRESIAKEREQLAEKIKLAREEQNTRIDTGALEEQREALEQDSIAIRDQISSAEEILKQHQDALKQWLTRNRVELISFYGTSDRVSGFDRDGDNRSRVALGVESLAGQVTNIKQDRVGLLNGWTSEVEAIWDSFESQINDLATDEQKSGGVIKVHRPYDQEKSNLNMINAIIPWFDTIVGVLLIIGLFSRFASLLGAGFLLSVILSQPPWIPGTTPTAYQAIELFALLVIFATCAGRCGGLDYFLHASSEPTVTENPEAEPIAEAA